MADAFRRKIQSRPKTPTIPSRKSEDRERQDASASLLPPGDTATRRSFPKLSNLLSIAQTQPLPQHEPEPFSVDQWSIDAPPPPPPPPDIDRIMQTLMTRLMTHPHEQLPVQFNQLLRRLLEAHSRMAEEKARLEAKVQQLGRDAEEQALEMKTKVNRENRSKSDGYHPLKPKALAKKGKSEDLLHSLPQSAPPGQPATPPVVGNTKTASQTLYGALFGSRAHNRENLPQAGRPHAATTPPIPTRTDTSSHTAHLSEDSHSTFSSNDEPIVTSDTASEAGDDISDKELSAIRRLADRMAQRHDMRLEDAMRTLVHTFRDSHQAGHFTAQSKKAGAHTLKTPTDGTDAPDTLEAAAFSSSLPVPAWPRAHDADAKSTKSSDEAATAGDFGKRHFSFYAGDDRSPYFSALNSEQGVQGTRSPLNEQGMESTSTITREESRRTKAYSADSRLRDRNADAQTPANHRPPHELLPHPEPRLRLPSNRPAQAR